MTRLERHFSVLLFKLGTPLTRRVFKDIEPEIIIILGTTVRKDGSPSFGLLKRVEKGVTLATQTATKNVVLSGGRKFAKSTEAEIMLATLKKLFPYDYDNLEIILEQSSRNTIENARYSTEIMRKLGYTKGLVITSPYHVGRVYREFAKFNVEIAVLPAFDPREYPLISHVKALLHEYLAIFVHSLHNLLRITGG